MKELYYDYSNSPVVDSPSSNDQKKKKPLFKIDWGRFCGALVYFSPFYISVLAFWWSVWQYGDVYKLSVENRKKIEHYEWCVNATNNTLEQCSSHKQTCPYHHTHH